MDKDFSRVSRLIRISGKRNRITSRIKGKELLLPSKILTLVLRLITHQEEANFLQTPEALLKSDSTTINSQISETPTLRIIFPKMEAQY